jgi:hypothetical protein
MKLVDLYLLAPNPVAVFSVFFTGPRTVGGIRGISFGF